MLKQKLGDADVDVNADADLSTDTNTLSLESRYMSSPGADNVEQLQLARRRQLALLLQKRRQRLRQQLLLQQQLLQQQQLKQQQQQKLSANGELTMELSTESLSASKLKVLFICDVLLTLY